MRQLLLLITMLCLFSCSSHFSTIINVGERSLIYQISETKAFELAHNAIVQVVPGRKITEITGPTRGYMTLWRRIIDTYSQQIIVVPASGTSHNGRHVEGYYFEVSGGGSAIIQGKMINKDLYETLIESLDNTKSSVFVNNLKKEKYRSSILKTKENISSTTNKDEIFLKIEKLHDLYKKGIINKEEYENKKKDLLDRL